MEVFTLVKWECSIIDGKIANTWDEAQVYGNIKDARTSMFSSIAEKLNLLDDFKDIPSIEISTHGAFIRAVNIDDEELFYKYQIFKGRVM